MGPVIDDGTPLDFMNGMATGLVERDYRAFPTGYSASAPPLEIKLIDMEEWPDRIREKKRLRSALTNVRRTSGPAGGPIPCLNQNSKKYNGRWGFCWTHSVTMAHMIVRAVMMQPHQKLSAFMVASILNNYQDKGGWSAKALEFIDANGQCVDALWPEDVVDPRMDTAAMRTDAMRHKITLAWADLAASMYDRTFTAKQFGTLLLSNVPVAADYNFMSHAVCMLDLEDMRPELKATDLRRYGATGINSWGDEWGDRGEFTLSGTRYIPNGAVAPMSAMAI